MKYIFARLREPSTYAGLAALLLGLAKLFPGAAPYFVAVSTVLGLFAAGTPDTTSTAESAPSPTIAAAVAADETTHP